MFYVAPLLFLALAIWIERGLPRPGWTPVVAGAAAALPAAIPYDRFIGVSAQSDTLALLPWWWLQERVLDLGWVRWEVLLCAVVVAVGVWAVPRRYGPALPAFVLVYFAVTTAAVANSAHGWRNASVGALYQGQTTGDRDWIDDIVGHDADVPFVWSGRTDVKVIWENEFFNRSVGEIVHLAGAPDGLPAASTERRGEDLVSEGPLGQRSARYALADDAVRFAGREIFRDEAKGVTLYAVDGPLRVSEAVDGVYDDEWSGPIFRYTRYRCDGGRVRVTLESDAGLFDERQRVALFAAGQRTATLSPGDRTTVTAPLRVGARQTCTLVGAVQPTAVPRERGRSLDTRRLGVLVRGLEYLP